MRQGPPSRLPCLPVPGGLWRPGGKWTPGNRAGMGSPGRQAVFFPVENFAVRLFFSTGTAGRSLHAFSFSRVKLLNRTPGAAVPGGLCRPIGASDRLATAGRQSPTGATGGRRPGAGRAAGSMRGMCVLRRFGGFQARQLLHRVNNGRKK